MVQGMLTCIKPGRNRWIFEFEVCIVYIVSSNAAKATQFGILLKQGPLLENKGKNGEMNGLIRITGIDEHCIPSDNVIIN